MSRRRPVPRRTALLLAAAAVLVLAGGGALAWRVAAGARAGVTVSFLHPFTAPAEERVLAEVLSEFSSLNPRMAVRAVARDPALLRGPGLAGAAGQGFDAATGTGPVPEGAWASPPSPWTGTLWVLAARRDVLDGLAGLEGPIEELRQGRLSPAGFEGLLAAVKARKLSPLTLGNSHRWPFLIWLQHWAAATLGPEAVTALPTGTAGADAAYLERLRPAYATLARWKADGWFDAAAWPEGWARGLRPLAEGRALFALVAAPLLTALPEDARKGLEFFPFPGSRGGDAAPWTIGSVYVLGVAKGARRAGESALLVRFLTSPGVTRTLSRRLGRPFFAWDAGTGQSPRVIPDWYGAQGTAQLRVLEQAFGAP
jgi:ABC-type glycerol-3-phosphate transport system substrate-binding protein